MPIANARERAARVVPSHWCFSFVRSIDRRHQCDRLGVWFAGCLGSDFIRPSTRRRDEDRRHRGRNLIEQSRMDGIRAPTSSLTSIPALSRRSLPLARRRPRRRRPGVAAPPRGLRRRELAIALRAEAAALPRRRPSASSRSSAPAASATSIRSTTSPTSAKHDGQELTGKGKIDTFFGQPGRLMKSPFAFKQHGQSRPVGQRPAAAPGRVRGRHDVHPFDGGEELEPHAGRRSR